MIKVTNRQWLQFYEGLNRKVIAFASSNRSEIRDGHLHPIREYKDGDVVVARMTNHEFDTHPGNEARKTFELAQSVIDATKYIYIPTREEKIEWDDSNISPEKSRWWIEIAKREPVE